MHNLPQTGFLRLNEILGQEGVTEAEAEANRREAKRLKQVVETGGDNGGDAEGGRITRKPRRSRPPIPPIIPVSRSSWWAGVKSGRYPKPVKLGPRTTAWRVEDILALTQKKEG